MPNNNREMYATAAKVGDIWVWHPRPNETKPFDDMDIDYLANCLRLVGRRRKELIDFSPGLGVRGDAVELLLEEDRKIINALINELNSREVGDYEDG